MARVASLIVASALPGALAHGWVTSPVSKNDLANKHFQEGMPGDFHYEPQSCNKGNGGGSMLQGKGYSCGADDQAYAEGLATWQKWYDAADVEVPHLVPGQDLNMEVNLTIDHGGQAWMMLSCDSGITETSQWTFLERAVSDRSHHFLPSNPAMYAWAPLEAQSLTNNGITTTWTVPSGFSCPSGKAVARWLWKTGNSCQDSKNVGRKTETFSLDELSAVYDEYQHHWMSECAAPPETFISCMDFVIASNSAALI